MPPWTWLTASDPKASNFALRYLGDLTRAGVLAIPTDDDQPLTLFSVFSSSVLLPPTGAPVLIEDIYQTGTWGRETYNRPDRRVQEVAQGGRISCADAASLSPRSG